MARETRGRKTQAYEDEVWSIMVAPLLSKAEMNKVVAQMRAAISKTAETQTVYLRHTVGRVVDIVGRPTADGTVTTVGPYKARVTEIKEANPFILRGIAGTLGTESPDEWLVGKALIELGTDLTLESKTEAMFAVVADGRYILYRPYKRDDAVVTHRDIMGETLVTYYVVAEFFGVEDIP